MKQKQNIANTLFLLVWAAMFCFAVLFTLHKPATQACNSTSSSSQYQEKLSPEDQTSPLAWIEPTDTETVAEQSISLLQVLHPFSWHFCHTELLSSTKLNNRLLASSGTIIRYLVQPNAP